MWISCNVGVEFHTIFCFGLNTKNFRRGLRTAAILCCHVAACQTPPYTVLSRNRQQSQQTSNPELQNLVNQGYSATCKCNIWNNSYKLHEAGHALFCYKTSSSSYSSSSYSTRSKTKFMRKLRYLVLVTLTAVHQCCLLICPSSTRVHVHLLTQIPNTCHF
jgi:hypothetical protein